jgi:hypothetical protein
VGFAASGASVAVLAACFLAAGAAIGCVETAEHAGGREARARRRTRLGLRPAGRRVARA